MATAPREPATLSDGTQRDARIRATFRRLAQPRQRLRVLGAYAQGQAAKVLRSLDTRLFTDAMQAVAHAARAEWTHARNALLHAVQTQRPADLLAAAAMARGAAQLFTVLARMSDLPAIHRAAQALDEAAGGAETAAYRIRARQIATKDAAIAAWMADRRDGELAELEQEESLRTQIESADRSVAVAMQIG